MNEITTAIQWLIDSQQPLNAMIKHTGLKARNGEIRLMPVTERERGFLPVFVFFKASGVYTHSEIEELREMFRHVGVVREMNGEGKHSYSVVVRLLANRSIRDAYKRYMVGCPEHEKGVLCPCGWSDHGSDRAVLPEGWSW